MFNKIMQAIGQRRIHASIYSNTPLNNNDWTTYDKQYTIFPIQVLTVIDLT
jgi:hypothetical protein